jgi:hypothetical protein
MRRSGIPNFQRTMVTRPGGTSAVGRYSYGPRLYKGQGVAKSEAEGVQYVKQAADEGVRGAPRAFGRQGRQSR